MKFFGQLEKAQLEVLGADPSAGLVGRIWWNTATGTSKLDDGTNIRSLLRNDGKAVIGNSGTVADNIRFHRGAAGVLQLVTGSDATAEGTLSTALNKLSFKFESYTNAGLPAAGNAGRVAWVSDLLGLKVDTGGAWIPVGSGGGGASLVWVEDALAPAVGFEYGQKHYAFVAGDTQYLYTGVRVPSSYQAGNPIRMKLPFYANDNTNAVSMRVLGTLIRTGVDAMSSTTNQITSDAAQDLSSFGTVNVEFSLNPLITSASGQVNGVSVAAGDIILVRLTRLSDTSPQDLKFLYTDIDVTYQ
jgi:hypothetical protein